MIGLCYYGILGNQQGEGFVDWLIAQNELAIKDREDLKSYKKKHAKNQKRHEEKVRELWTNVSDELDND